MTDLSHLPLDLREIAAEDNAQRIAFIRGQWWIGYPQAQAALDPYVAGAESLRQAARFVISRQN